VPGTVGGGLRSEGAFNLELGYLTPPVGTNLFLSSYRFDRPLLEVYRASIPMLVILGIGVLLITGRVTCFGCSAPADSPTPPGRFRTSTGRSPQDPR
jgi:hypothetical protein